MKAYKPLKKRIQDKHINATINILGRGHLAGGILAPWVRKDVQL